jgi:hypothetical protein
MKKKNAQIQSLFPQIWSWKIGQGNASARTLDPPRIRIPICQVNM